MRVGELRKLLAEYPDDFTLVGQALTPDGAWLNYPVSVGKALGDNTMVIIQLKPLPEISEEK